jgi:hypothetical protein
MFPGPPEESYRQDGLWNREASPVCRVLFDAAGNIFPDPSKLEIEDGQLAEAGGSLERYFSGNPRYSPRTIAAEVTAEINEECRKSGSTLVVLIHGIDNLYAEAHRTFELARMRLGELFPRRPMVFLEVYWDAHVGSPLAAWGNARPDSKWVGLGLRPLLAGIHGTIPVRILTHSRGAAVASSALWNVPLREGLPLDREYAERQGAIPVPSHPDVRLAMIAPAIGEDEFDTYGSTALDRVILGINEDDPALNKGFLGPRFGGSTRLGCRMSAFDEVVSPLLNRDRKVAFAVNLSASRDHDFKDYLLRRPVRDHLLPLLLESRPAILTDLPPARPE